MYTELTLQIQTENSKVFLFFIFLAFDFCQFCIVIRFFHPRHNGQWPFSVPDFIHYIYFHILIIEKEPVFPFFNVQY